MSSERTNFIPRNDGFTCDKCQQVVPPAKGTFRNHCPACLTSKHVDQDVPGDRAATCGGLMPTIRYEGTDPDKIDLIQKCQTCGKIMTNKIARDDIKEVAWQLIPLEASRPKAAVAVPSKRQGGL